MGNMNGPLDEILRRERQAQGCRSTAEPTTLGRLIGTSTAATAESIQRRAAELSQRIKDDDLDERIIWKVARALEERRISEAAIYSILENLLHARNRGAYFVAGVKRAFNAVDLDWHQETWQ